MTNLLDSAVRPTGSRFGARSRSGSGVATGDALVDTVADDEWDATLSGFDDGSLEQSAAFCRQRWCEGHDSHVMVVRDGRPMAMARVATFRLPLLGGGLAFVKFGPVWRRNGDRDASAYRQVMSALTREYCDRRGLMLTVQPRPSPDSQPMEDAALGDLGFARRRPMASPERYFVNLGLAADEQRKSLGQKWRYNLRKAEEAGLDIADEPAPDSFAIFATMHNEMVARKNAADGDPIDFLPSLFRQLPAGCRPHAIIARHRGRAIAGAIVATFGDTAYYLYGASRNQALGLNAGFGLQWWITRWLSERGARWYDLGGAPEGSTLAQFKRGLVGKAGHAVPQIGECDRWVRGRDRMAADALFRIRTLSQTVRGRLQSRSAAKAG